MKKQGIAKQIFKYACIVLDILIVMLAGVIIYAKANSRPVFLFQHTYIFVMTESMEPSIPARSYIKAEKVNAADVEVGDVIVFYSDDPAIEGKLNTHRVQAKIGDTGFITKGDNNAGEDKYPARAENVVARYVGGVPLLTALSSFFLSRAGLAITLICIFALCLGMYLPDILRGGKKQSANEADATHDEFIRQRIAEEVEKLKQSSKNTENEKK